MPSRQFERRARVDIGAPGAPGVSIEALRIEFTVLKTLTQAANTIRVSLYNVSPLTRARISEQGGKVLVHAGYGELSEDELLAIGDISRVWHAVEPPDRVTHIEAGDGLNALREQLTSLSFDAGTRAQTVLERLANEMGTGLSARRPLPAAQSSEYAQGFSFVGPVSEALDKVSDRLGLVWSVQNDQLQLNERVGLEQREGIRLTPESGLLAVPEPIEDLTTDLSGEQVEKGYRARALLQPKLEPGLTVELEIDGELTPFKIRSVEHSGDTRGPQWESVIEVSES